MFMYDHADELSQLYHTYLNGNKRDAALAFNSLERPLLWLKGYLMEFEGLQEVQANRLTLEVATLAEYHRNRNK